MVNLDSNFMQSMDQFEHEDWKNANPTFQTILRCPSKYERRWGTWSGEAIGYVLNR